MKEYVRCIFCLSGNEEKIKSAVESQKLGRVIIPMRKKPYKNNGIWEIREDKMMPGYVFVYSDKETDYSKTKRVGDVINILHYGSEPADSYLRGSDLEFARLLRDHDGVMPILSAVREGDYIKVNDIILEKMHGKTTGINKGRHMVNIEIQLLGTSRNIWLGYEIPDSP